MSVPKQQDLVDAILADHREVEPLLDEMEASGDARHRGELVERVTAELVRHTVAERQYLYPAVRRALPDGDALADRELERHAGIERTMKDLDRTDPADPRFAALVRSLAGDVRRHLREQERDLLVRLRAASDEADLRELGLRFEQGRRIAPTRPHPAAPDSAPASKLLSPGMALLDRVRDAITGRAR